MQLVHAYLKTALFHFDQDKENPAGVVAVSGSLVENTGGGLTIQVTTWRNEKGRELEGSPRTLFIPWGKLDHVDLSE